MVGVLALPRIRKMFGQITLLRFHCPGPRLSVVNLPHKSVRCSSHTAVSSEDPSGKPYVNTITAGGHTFKGDLGAEPWGAGGTAPEPKDYAYAALALCTSMTIRLYADRRKWPLKHVEVSVEEVNGRPGLAPHGLHTILKLEGDLTKQQKDELMRISANCPVKQLFSGKIRDRISIELSEEASASVL